MHAYTVTADKLSGQYLYDWKPPGSPELYVPSDQETNRQQADLRSCASTLNAVLEKNVPIPSREVRAIQLSHCMEAKGWQLLPVEVLVTG
jgi:hypothetical protein